MIGNAKLLLIGGASHSGKSSLAGGIATRLQIKCISTDSLARHPGRPWRSAPEDVPAHVADHYLSMTASELVGDVLRHYRDIVGPLVNDVIDAHCRLPGQSRLVIEGSALLPELVAAMDQPGIAAIWLIASDDVLRRRIHVSSQYETNSARQRLMIDKFVARNALFNEHVKHEVSQHGFVSIESDCVSQSAELTDQCVAVLGQLIPWRT